MRQITTRHLLIIPPLVSSTFPFPYIPLLTNVNLRNITPVARISKNHAIVLLLTLHRCWSQHAPNRLIEYALQPLLCQRGTLQVLIRMNIPRHLVTLCIRDGLHPPIAQLGDGLWVLSQIQLGTDEDGGDVGSVMRDFRPPFGSYVFERRWRDEREADKENVGLGIGERS